MPSTVTVPSGNSVSIVSVIGPSLQTLQHQRKSFAGGPKASTLSQNPFPPDATWSLLPCSSANPLTYSTVSGNSSPVSMYMSSTVSAACDARP